MSSPKLILVFILILATFLRIYRLEDLMMFIGDQGWFYLSARDLLLTGNIPLVGITASHTWLHQGSLWTYILAPILWLLNFHPVGGAYLAAFLGVLSVFVIYYVGKNLFKNEGVGLIAAFLFATSPLVIIHSRMPYHITPIPLAVLAFIFAIYKCLTGKVSLYLPIAAFMLGLLYNLELATMVFWIFPLFVFLYLKKIQTKTITLSIVSLLVPMIPMIIYDFVSKEGFYQTTAFFRLIKVSVLSANMLSPEVISNIFRDLFTYNQRLVFLGNGLIAGSITIGSFFYLFSVLRNNLKKKKIEFSPLIISLWILISLAGIFISKIASEAYLPMFFPGIILLIAFSLSEIVKQFPGLKMGIYILIGAISIINVYLLLSQDYLMRDKGYGPIFSDRLKVARKIINDAGNNRYNTVGIGEGSQFENFTKNYEYITWWLGNPPSKKKERLQFIIREQNGAIILNKLSI